MKAVFVTVVDGMNYWLDRIVGFVISFAALWREE